MGSRWSARRAACVLAVCLGAAGTLPGIAFAQAAAPARARAVLRRPIAIQSGGQVVVVSEEPFGEVVEAAESSVEAAAADEDANLTPEQREQKSKADALKQEKLQKIAQLQFDRRPSAILKLWVEEQEAKTKAAEADPRNPETKPTDAEDKDESDDAAETPDDASETSTNDGEAAADQAAATGQQPAATDAGASAESPAATTAEGAAPEADAAPAENDQPAGDEKPAEETEEQKQAREAAERAKREAEEAKAAAELFDKQLKQFQTDVTGGRWSAVQEFLASLDEEIAKAAYNRLLDALASGPAAQAQADPGMLAQMVMQGADTSMIQARLSAMGQGPGAQFNEGNFVSVVDMTAIVRAAPYKLDRETFAKLGAIVQQLKQAGHDLDELLRLLAGDDAVEGSRVLDPRQTALLLVACGESVRMGEFLPDLQQAETDNDREALNLLAVHFLALHDQEKKSIHLESAWTALQAVLAVGEVDKEQKDEALRRAVELAPRLRDQLGQKWLEESFTSRIDRGREILASIGAQMSLGLASRPHDAQFRLQALQLQKTAVEALLAAAPNAVEEWREPLTLLAINWLKEGDVSHQYDDSQQYGSQWQRDRYGNYFYVDDADSGMMYPQMQGAVAAIRTSDLLEARPTERWMAAVDASLAPRFAATLSRLYLKIHEEDEAFPHIERLAQTHPDEARDLANEFLRTWTNNHNPNEDRDRGPYIYYYSYLQRAERIPLTRSKQQRNLAELTEWIKRLRALPIDKLDEPLLTRAFTICHSQAEVYRLEAIESVFGSIDSLKPRTLAELIQQMRGNLAGVWRQPDVQRTAGTNRKQKDMQAEVERGYATALAVVESARAKQSEDWSLRLAQAAVRHDQAEYRNDLAKSADYTERRRASMAEFADAARLYAARVGELNEDEYATLVYEQWFHAALGSVDLGRVTGDMVPDLTQPALIRAAIESLPGEVADKHLERFANSLFTRLSDCKPELKLRYLKAGFAVVGDHKLAYEARKVLDYYDDLVTEIKLEAEIDGPTDVGLEPFGVFVNLVHTKEIERESGGFAKYLQNQNNMYYAYNFGRPTENYRDKFSDTVEQLLGEHFEVLSVTFQHPEVNSRAMPEYGWRETPYAYLLLKARGPEIDKVPPLRIDLDFLDTSGYAVLPVESPALPINALVETPTTRPFDNLKITQTLDERQAHKGKLILEVKATAHGLVPKLDELLDIEATGFEVVDTKDEGVSIAEFDKEAESNVISSERIWMVTLETAEKPGPRPTKFAFAAPRVDEAETVYQRYVDADLLAVERVVDLEQQYGRPSRAWIGWVVGGLAAVLALGAVVWLTTRSTETKTAQSRFQMPEAVTAFTVLGLLRDIQTNNGLSEESRRELSQSIDHVERHYFADVDAEEVDLRSLASRWVERAR